MFYRARTSRGQCAYQNRTFFSYGTTPDPPYAVPGVTITASPSEIQIGDGLPNSSVSVDVTFTASGGMVFWDPCIGPGCNLHPVYARARKGDGTFGTTLADFNFTAYSDFTVTRLGSCPDGAPVCTYRFSFLRDAQGRPLTSLVDLQMLVFFGWSPALNETGDAAWVPLLYVR